MGELSGVHAKKIKKLDNAGMTLMELIVVIAIMGVVLGSMVLSSGFVGKSRITSAYELLQSNYSLARSNSMTKAVATDLTITLKDGYYYIQVGDEAEERLISGSTPITFNVYSGNTETKDVSFEDMASLQGSTTNTVTLSFSKGSGALKSYGSGSYISAIFIDNKGIYITFETGKYSTTEYDDALTGTTAGE